MRVAPSIHPAAGKCLWVDEAISHIASSPTDLEPALGIVRYPERIARKNFYALAYPLMFLSRRMEERMVELYKKGYVKGTVTTGVGNEATALGMALPLRPGRDVVSIMHRDFLGHLLLGATPRQLFCQYMANAESPTHGREGNVHHGDAASRRFPMMSHLGKMPSLVVGGTWAARRNGEDAFGLSVIGDGGSSTGEFHESLNLAALHRVPVLFVIENNYYSFSTPISAQYANKQLSERAKGFGISGRTIDGTDAWGVYAAICDALDAIHADPGPRIIECMTLRLHGHAVYDNGEYVPDELMQKWRSQDPLPAARRKLQSQCGFSEAAIGTIESRVEEEIQAALDSALHCPRPAPGRQSFPVFAPAVESKVEPFRAPPIKNGEAVKKCKSICSPAIPTPS